METIASIKELKASGFFNLSLPDKEKSGRPFKVTLRDIEEVFKMINPGSDGKRVLLNDLK
jgi:Ca2+-binding EF-hand superfamily protein